MIRTDIADIRQSPNGNMRDDERKIAMEKTNALLIVMVSGALLMML